MACMPSVCQRTSASRMPDQVTTTLLSPADAGENELACWCGQTSSCACRQCHTSAFLSLSATCHLTSLLLWRSFRCSYCGCALTTRVFVGRAKGQMGGKLADFVACSPRPPRASRQTRSRTRTQSALAKVHCQHHHRPGSQHRIESTSRLPAAQRLHTRGQSENTRVLYFTPWICRMHLPYKVDVALRTTRRRDEKARWR
jgi:hypothetical protein